MAMPVWKAEALFNKDKGFLLVLAQECRWDAHLPASATEPVYTTE